MLLTTSSVIGSRFFVAKSRTYSMACLCRRISSHTGCRLESGTTVSAESVAVFSSWKV